MADMAVGDVDVRTFVTGGMGAGSQFAFEEEVTWQLASQPAYCRLSGWG